MVDKTKLAACGLSVQVCVSNLLLCGDGEHTINPLPSACNALDIAIEELKLAALAYQEAMAALDKE